MMFLGYETSPQSPQSQPSRPDKVKKRRTDDDDRLASVAFSNVLHRKQSSYGTVSAWLNRRMALCEAENGLEAERLRKVVIQGNRVFSGYRF